MCHQLFTLLEFKKIGCQNRLRTWVILLIMLSVSYRCHAETGSHGGDLQSLRPYENSSLLPGRSIELVEEFDPDSKNRTFRIYLIGANADSQNLMSVGSWEVGWRTEKKKGRLQDNLKKEKERIWKEKTPDAPLYSFAASGKLPDDGDLVIEVIIALPGKGGTGIAVFNGVNSR